MSLLASIVLVATNNVRSLARDSQRIQAIAMIQTSLELYYDDHGQYPGNKCPIDTGSAKITDYDTLGVTGNAGNVNYNLKCNWNGLLSDLNTGNYLSKAENIDKQKEYAQSPILSRIFAWLWPTADAAGNVSIQDPLFSAGTRTYSYMPSGATPINQDYRLRVQLENVNNPILKNAIVGEFLDTCDSDNPADINTICSEDGKSVYRPYNPWLECAPQPQTGTWIYGSGGNSAEGVLNASFYGYYCVGSKQDNTFTGFAPGKPVIYLYPTHKEEVSVKIAPKSVDVSVPAYGNGWDVTANPDGAIFDPTDGNTYPYLYWEGSSDRPIIDRTKGFVIATAEIKTFLSEALTEQGLNEGEADAFIEYWAPRMTTDSPYVYVYFMPQPDYDKLVPMTVSPKPDTVIRVYMLWKPLDNPITVSPEPLSALKRTGFTVIEWGGDRSPLQ